MSANRPKRTAGFKVPVPGHTTDFMWVLGTPFRGPFLNPVKSSEWFGRNSEFRCAVETGGRPRRQAQRVEDFSYRVGRVNRGEDSHASLTAGAFQNVQLPYPLH